MNQSGRAASPGDAVRVPLDTLFRSHVKDRGSKLALVDPIDRASFTDGSARRLTFAEVDAAVDQLARRFKAIGLTEHSIIATQIPNIVEGVIALLAAIRAGLVPVPVPVPWGRSELAIALNTVEAKALVTVAQVGDRRPAETACEAAAEVFGLSFPCAFGADLPDGVIPLELETKATEAQRLTITAPAMNPDDVAIATIDAAPRGFFAVGRSHAEWVAGGLAVVLEAHIEAGDTIVSTLPPTSLAGITAALVPWLITGGTLQLIQGHSPHAVAASVRGERRHLVTPATTLADNAGAASEPFTSCIAVHRGTETRALDFSALPTAAVVDLTVFGEIGAVALARQQPAYARSIPVGPIRSPSARNEAPAMVETLRRADGALFLRGPMVPRRPFPPAVPTEAPRLVSDLDGYVRTGFRCGLNDDGRLVLEENPKGVVTIGGVRFGLEDVARQVASIVQDAKVEKVVDPLLGERLRIETADPKAASLLAEAGLSLLIVNGVVAATADPAPANR